MEHRLLPLRWLIHCHILVTAFADLCHGRARVWNLLLTSLPIVKLSNHVVFWFLVLFIIYWFVKKIVGTFRATPCRQHMKPIFIDLDWLQLVLKNLSLHILKEAMREATAALQHYVMNRLLLQYTLFEHFIQTNPHVLVPSRVLGDALQIVLCQIELLV